MRVGLPSALVNQYYISFWRTFFAEPGVEVIGSGETTKNILDKGIRYSVPEICAPIKIYTGHVVDLLDQEIDYVYVPRFISIRKPDTFCPKFLGLPDMLSCTIPGLKEKLLTHYIKPENDLIAKKDTFLALGRVFTDDRKRIKRAIGKASAAWREFRALSVNKGYNCKEANSIIFGHKELQQPKSLPRPIKLGVIGYVYNIYDDFISMNILDRLSSLGVEVVTFEMLSEKELEKELKKYRKTPFWTFSNKLLAAAGKFLADQSIDGLIHVTAFGCGPDSFLGKVLELDSVTYQKPFITVRIDEHTEENHLQTRIEAFVDMIYRKKQKHRGLTDDEDYLSLHGTDACVQEAN